MAQTQVNITESNEAALRTLKTIGQINNIDVSNKENQINFAIKIAEQMVRMLDEESLINLTGLKKSI